VIVVDANVLLASVLRDTEAGHRYAAQLAAAGAAGEPLAAPAVLPAEVSYVLLKQGRRNRWGEAKTAENAEIVDLFRVELFMIEQSVAAQVRFATRHNVQGFDALYLALAMSLGARLATLDGGLRSAARAAGVELSS